MPRERITYARRTITADETTRDHAPTELHVCWDKAGEHGTDGWVQVMCDTDTDWLRRLAGEDGAVSAGVFSERLGRSDLNRLIRTLRKARDQAYGADE